VDAHADPDDKQLALHVTLQALQEVDHLLGLNRTWLEENVKIQRGQPGDGWSRGKDPDVFKL
jgi:hypothetical protein